MQARNTSVDNCHSAGGRLHPHAELEKLFKSYSARAAGGGNALWTNTTWDTFVFPVVHFG